MQKIRGKKKLLLYGMAGLGVNMLNLIIGSYLCDALMVEGFQEDVGNWTYLNKTLIVASVWSIMIAISKVLDGVIDIPFAGWTDKLKSRWGKRRPAILIGMIPMMIAYVLFLSTVTEQRTQYFEYHLVRSNAVRILRLLYVDYGYVLRNLFRNRR